MYVRVQKYLSQTWLAKKLRKCAAVQNLWQKIHRCPFLIGQGKFLRSQNQEKARVYCFGNQDRLITKMVWDGLGGDHWST